MILALEKFRLRKVDALCMHGGQRGGDWCSGSGSARPFKRLSIESWEIPEKQRTCKGKESVAETTRCGCGVNWIDEWKARRGKEIVRLRDISWSDHG